MILEALQFLPNYGRFTERRAMLFTPMTPNVKNAGRVMTTKKIPVFLCNGTDTMDTVSNITKDGDAGGIVLDVVAPLTVPARSSQAATLSIEYGGPAVYHAVVTFTASGSAPAITIDGTRGDPYGISIEVGGTPDKLVIRGGVAYGWSDAGITVTLPFALVQDTEYYFEFAWNHITGDHSIFINGVLIGTVNVQSGTAGVVNRIIPGVYRYLDTAVGNATLYFDTLIVSTDPARDLNALKMPDV